MADLGMRTAIVLAVGLLGCHPRMGPSPGPKAVICLPGSAGCDEVNEQLDLVRDNIGGWCGTPDVMAAWSLARMGPAVAGHLARALSDRDVQVAWVAADALIDMGEGERVRRWCARHPDYQHAATLCAGLAARIDAPDAVERRRLLSAQQVED